MQWLMWLKKRIGLRIHEFDPLADGLLNRVSANSNLRGAQEFAGGLVIEGAVSGDPLIVHGVLILCGGATLTGKVRVHGDAYIAGVVGTSTDTGDEMVVDGVVHLGSTARTFGAISAPKMVTYEGCEIVGLVRTGASYLKK